jgi:two-component system, NtrC family, sensor kinase
MGESKKNPTDKSVVPKGKIAQNRTLAEPGFEELGESIIESLCPGVVAFDRELKIIQANKEARKLIDVEEYFDQSLAKGTDEKIWGDWGRLLKEMISTKKKSEFDLVKYSHNDQTRLLYIVCSTLISSRTREVLGGAAVIEDVTQRVDIEHQLAQAERLASVGKVAGKVAHELNNPIDGILRYVNLAIRVIDTDDISKVKEYLEQSRQGLMRMAGIIGELLEFSRFAYVSFESVAVDQIIEDALKAMESVTKDIEIEIIKDYTGQIPLIKGGNIFQVFCNLIKNASDAMSGKGRLSITIKKENKDILVEFHDGGDGFDLEHAEKIFEPFFTTKGRGKGTGLGLAICKDIIEKYKGTISAENAPDGGSIFVVKLPLAENNKR